MFSFLKVPTVNKELWELTDKLSKTVNTLRRQSSAFSDLSKSIIGIIQTEAPNYASYFEKISEIYKRLSYIYMNSSYQVDRALEDLKDINARFDVVKRSENERNAAKNQFNIACVEADKAYKGIVKDNPQTTERYQQSMRKRSEMAQQLVFKDQELLEQRKKYRAFTMRRIKSAWQRYGQALADLYVLESAAFNELAVFYKSIKDHASEPEKILSKIRVNQVPLPVTSIPLIQEPEQQQEIEQTRNDPLEIAAPELG